MSKRELNPELVKGDRVMCLHMDGETGVPMGVEGVVTKVGRDPFEEDGKIIEVKWDNGSSLALISVTDSWVKVADSQIKESKVGDSRIDYFSENPEIFDHFDWRFFREFLNKVRESGVVNMYSSSPFLFSGKEWINMNYGTNQEDNEEYEEMLDMANKSKDKMVQGILSYMDSKNMEPELTSVNRYVRKFAEKLVKLYISFF
jgi:hypothetical protein